MKQNIEKQQLPEKSDIKLVTNQWLRILMQ